MNQFRVYVRDITDVNTSTLEMPLVGEVDNFTNFTCTLRHNAVGSWLMSLPAGSNKARLLTPGRGIVVYREGEPLWPVFTGPIGQIQKTWDKDSGKSGVLSISGPCDNSILRERVGRLTPAGSLQYEGFDPVADLHPDGFQFPATVTKYTPILFGNGVAREPKNSGEFIWAVLVGNFQLAEGFQSFSHVDFSRLCVQLDLEHKNNDFNARVPPPYITDLPDDDVWRGFPVNMSNLEDVIFSIAEAAGLVVRFSWQPKSRTGVSTATNKIFFNIGPTEDKSDSVVFGEELGNLTSYTFTASAPAATRAILGGQTSSSDRRYYTERKNDFFDPSGWVDADDKDANGNWRHDTSDPFGRQSIEVDWNTTAEVFVDARDVDWEFQPAQWDNLASQDPDPGSDADNGIIQDSIQALLDNGPQAQFTMEAVDTPIQAYGVDYGVSDTVRVLVDTHLVPKSVLDADGIFRERVEEVTLSSSANEVWKVSPTVGTNTSTTPYLYRQLKKVNTRLLETEARLEKKTLSSFKPAPAFIRLTWSSGSTIGTSTGFCFTDRPTVGQQFQVQTFVSAGTGSPNYVDVSSGDVQIDMRLGETGPWQTIPPGTISNNGLSTWYKNLSITTAVNDVMYLRSRISKDGAVSDWSEVIKLTAASSGLNTSGSVTLNSVPSVTFDQRATVTLTGTDTTRGVLRLKTSSDGGSTWFSGPTLHEILPTFSGSNFTFRYVVRDDFAGHPFLIRVESYNNNNFDTLIAASNSRTINV